MAVSNRHGYMVLLLAVLAVLSVVVPFTVWHQTWFGRELRDPEVERYLADNERPRRIQHALSQISDRIQRGDPARQWYPRIVELSARGSAEVRTTAAWVMGQDNHSQEFRRTLVNLLKDSDLMVRRNAALSLVRFGDSSGRGELVNMLRSEVVKAPSGGTLQIRLQTGQAVGVGALLARVRSQDGREMEVRSRTSGEVERIHAADGSNVASGEPLIRIQPNPEHAWEALRGLYIVGQQEDLPEVELYARGGASVPAALQRQAALTMQAIKNRSGPIPTH